MNTTPTTHRFVAVLNKKIEPGRAMNAVAHMAAGFTTLYPNKSDVQPITVAAANVVVTPPHLQPICSVHLLIPYTT